MQLKGQVSELEAELAEQQHLKRQALDEGDFLRMELDELKKRHEDTEKAQRSLTEVESKWGWGEPCSPGASGGAHMTHDVALGALPLVLS